MKSAIWSNLDPHTLRWVADEHERFASRDQHASDSCRMDYNQTGCIREDLRESAEHWQLQARNHRDDAKRYRGLATRVENRRGRK